MPITQQLKPDPIVTSNVEIRMESSLKSAEFLAKAVEAFHSLLPQSRVADNRVPDLIKDDPHSDFRFTPDLIFHNDLYAVSVGRNVILFEILHQYPGWSAYFLFIKQVLEKAATSLGIESIVRCGVRYASIFPDFSKISDALNYETSFSLPEYRRVNDFVRTAFVKDDIQLLLQIGENIQVHQKGRGNKQGLYLDIDASTSQGLPSAVNQSLFDTIDRLHDAEKDLFEHLVKQKVLHAMLENS